MQQAGMLQHPHLCLCLRGGPGLQVGVKEGVVFLTYSSLISSSEKGDTRLQQLVDWAGSAFDGLIIFDECHKAKNLVPEAGSKSTKVRACAPRPRPSAPPATPAPSQATASWS